MIKLDSPSAERRLIPVWEITMPYAAAGLSAAITDTAAAAAAAALQSRRRANAAAFISFGERLVALIYSRMTAMLYTCLVQTDCRPLSNSVAEHD